MTVNPANIPNPSLRPIVVRSLFDMGKQSDENGIEFWSARDLMVVFEYSGWERFRDLITRAQASCEKSGQTTKDHFRPCVKMVDIGSGAQRQQEDFQLTRYACYLIAQNGDPTQKDAIAIAQTYFAMQTRKQEIREESEPARERLRAREQLKEAESDFADLLFDRGFDGKEISHVRSEGDQALFSIPTQGMKARLNVPKGRPLADFLSGVALSAKSLATSLTNYNTRTKDVKNKVAIRYNHIENNQGVRGLLKDKGIRPEELPAEEDLLKVERRLKKTTNIGAPTPPPQIENS